MYICCQQFHVRKLYFLRSQATDPMLCSGSSFLAFQLRPVFCLVFLGVLQRHRALFCIFEKALISTANCAKSEAMSIFVNERSHEVLQRCQSICNAIKLIHGGNNAQAVLQIHLLTGWRCGISSPRSELAWVIYFQIYTKFGLVVAHLGIRLTKNPPFLKEPACRMEAFSGVTFTGINKGKVIPLFNFKN